MKGRWISLCRREEPAKPACRVEENCIFPVRTPRADLEKYRYMMMGKIKSKRNAHGVAKFIKRVPKVTYQVSRGQGVEGPSD